MAFKAPPCDVTLEFSTSSPLTAQQTALYEAIREVVQKHDQHVSLRAYALSGKGKSPLQPVKTTVIKKATGRRK